MANVPKLVARATDSGQLFLDISCSALLESFLTVVNATLYAGSSQLMNATMNSTVNGSSSYLAHGILLSASIPVTPLNDSLAVRYTVSYSLGNDSDTLASSQATLDFYSLFFCMQRLFLFVNKQ